MARTITTSLQVSASGDGATSSDPIVVSNPNGIATGTTPVVLSVGNNTITIPAGHIGAVVVPPAGNTNAWTLKGVGGDAGMSSAPGLPIGPIYPAAGAGGTFVINVGIGMTVGVQYV